MKICECDDPKIGESFVCPQCGGRRGEAPASEEEQLRTRMEERHMGPRNAKRPMSPMGTPTTNRCLYCGTPEHVSYEMAGDVQLGFHREYDCDCDQAARKAELETAKQLRMEYSGADEDAVFLALRKAAAPDLDCPPAVYPDHFLLLTPARPFDEGDLINAHRAIVSEGGVPGPLTVADNWSDFTKPEGA